MKAIAIAHREPRSFSDRWAYQMVRLLRWGTDVCTGYRHDPKKPYVMNERKWMVRFIFLETVSYSLANFPFRRSISLGMCRVASYQVIYGDIISPIPGLGGFTDINLQYI
jgi:hypothetical protein